MKNEEQNKILDIVRDVIAEINGEDTGRIEGTNLTSSEYVKSRLMFLFDVVKGMVTIEEQMNHLSNQRNKLSREISTLKKVALNK